MALPARPSKNERLPSGDGARCSGAPFIAAGRSALVEISTDQLSASIAAPGIGRRNSTEYSRSKVSRSVAASSASSSRTGSGTVISCPCPT